MPAPRIFVSSTAYDFGLLRGQLRSFVSQLGFEPVLSEYADILFDPRTHTHSSCVKEVVGCDVLVLIVGSRFGSEAIAQAVAELDVKALADASSAAGFLTDPSSKVSVTQLEVLNAIEQGVPVFAFVDERVLHDHATYDANRDAPFLEDLRFASISQPETARYIFSFVDFLRGRVANNAIFSFAKIEDIEGQLRRQWSALFQRLLAEQRGEVEDRQRIDRLSEQFEDLKAAILATIGDAPSRDVARGALAYRYLVDVLRALDVPDLRRRVEDGASWADVMKSCGIEWPAAIEVIRANDRVERDRVVIKRVGAPPLLAQMSSSRFLRLPDEWQQYMALTAGARLAVFDAVFSEGSFRPQLFRQLLPPPPEVSIDEEPF